MRRFAGHLPVWDTYAICILFHRVLQLTIVVIFVGEKENRTPLQGNKSSLIHIDANHNCSVTIRIAPQSHAHAKIHREKKLLCNLYTRAFHRSGLVRPFFWGVLWNCNYSRLTSFSTPRLPLPHRHPHSRLSTRGSSELCTWHVHVQFIRVTS